MDATDEITAKLAALLKKLKSEKPEFVEGFIRTHTIATRLADGEVPKGLSGLNEQMIEALAAIGAAENILRGELPLPTMRDFLE